MRSETRSRLWQDCEMVLSKINEMSKPESDGVTIEDLQKSLPLFKVVREMCFFLKEYGLVDCKDEINKKTKVSLTHKGLLYIYYHDNSLLKYRE